MMERGPKSLLIHGIINIVIHIPALVATSMWALLMIGILGLLSVSSPAEGMITIFPIAIPLISCIAGVIRGTIHIRHYKDAKACLLLSLLGIVLYVGMIAFCTWVGSFV